MLAHAVHPIHVLRGHCPVRGREDSMPGSLILVVEDDPIQCEGLRVILERAGYGVTITSTPGEALASLAGPPTPALILLDMLFPRSRSGDGWHFLYSRQHQPTLLEIPVLIVTALGNASLEWAVGLGASGYLRKPLDGELLLAEVRRLCAA